MKTEELRVRELREEVRRAERQLAAALDRDPDAPMSALRFLVPEAVARLRAVAGAASTVSTDPHLTSAVTLSRRG
ncbi:hypothetical protein GCM10023320_49520 [Pseudonocardia adelaidensis]|uniref:Uncharacterized protein n=1 Tax=Pseudonocardia adelaidensis TaxID=648754 RepID=A0ABP9NU93_9PSEU